MLASETPLSAQDSGRPLPPLAQGVFLEWNGSSGAGTFVFRTADERLHKCAFSGKTYFEEDHKRAAITSIAVGQKLEVLSERIPEPPTCRALIVRVVLPIPSSGRPRAHSASFSTEPLVPRGNLIYTGVIVRRDEDAFLLRTRAGQSHWIQLRKDTRLSDAGSLTNRDRLPLNRPVQIRAGRSFENELEAFSIVWGEILKP